MAAQVLSGTGALAYTNNTGENVRIVINFLRIGSSDGGMTWGGGANINLVSDCTIGRNIAFLDTINTSLGGIAGQNAFTNHAGGFEGAPTELALANGDTFSLTDGGGSTSNTYNILVIPESG